MCAFRSMAGVCCIFCMQKMQSAASQKAPTMIMCVATAGESECRGIPTKEANGPGRQVGNGQRQVKHTRKDSGACAEPMRVAPKGNLQRQEAFCRRSDDLEMSEAPAWQNYQGGLPGRHFVYTACRHAEHEILLSPGGKPTQAAGARLVRSLHSAFSGNT